jgi:hypothetical protein
MAALLPFHRFPRLDSSHVGLQCVAEVNQRLDADHAARRPSTLDWLLAQAHGVEARIDVGRERFVLCLCGHVAQVFGDEWPDECGMDLVLRARAWTPYERTLASGTREHEYLALLLSPERR